MNIILKDLTFYYEDRLILDHFNCNIKDGEIVALLGPSGCGKSTLLKLLLGLIEPTDGEILFNGEVPTTKHKIAAHLSECRLFPWMTLEKNLRTTGSKQEAWECLKELEMEEWADYYPSAISVGMTQKIHMARFSMLEAELWLLDEPFNGLDLKSKALVQDFLKRRRKNRTTIIVTHNLKEATNFADRVLLWNKEKHCPDREWINDGNSEKLLEYMLQEALGMEGLEC